MISHQTNQIVIAAQARGNLRRRFCFVALLTATLAVPPTGSNAEQPTTPTRTAERSSAHYIQSELLVKVRDPGASLQMAMSPHEMLRATVLRSFPAIGWDRVRLPEWMSVGE